MYLFSLLISSFLKVLHLQMPSRQIIQHFGGEVFELMSTHTCSLEGDGMAEDAFILTPQDKKPTTKCPAFILSGLQVL